MDSSVSPLQDSSTAVANDALEDQIPVLALAKSLFGETVLIHSKTVPGFDEPKWNDFLQYHNFTVVESGHGRITILSTLQCKQDRLGKKYLFGGRSFHQATKQLVIGDADVSRFGIDAHSLKEDCGEFHLVEIDDDKVTFSADYYGIQQLFYYDSDGLYVIATSYHLLLLVLKTLGVDLSIDISRSRHMLQETDTFASDISIEMRHCATNSPCERFEIDDGGVSIVRNEPLFNQLYDKGNEFDDLEYARLVAQGRDEVVSNVGMVFEYPDFDKVVVDLSGGFDSRIVFAAATVLPQTLVREKILVNQQFAPSPSAKQGDEPAFAAALSRLYDYPLFDDSYEDRFQYVELTDRSDHRLMHQNRISRSMGTHKNFNHIVPRNVDYYVKNVTRLSGFCGGPYRGVDQKTPQKTVAFTQHRNRYMATRAFENILSPLMSKKMLQAALMYIYSHPSELFSVPEMDLLTAINPFLGKMPFFNKSINEFLNSADPNELLRYPMHIDIAVKPILDAENTRFVVKSNPNEFDHVILRDEQRTIRMLNAIVEFDSSYEDIVDPMLSKGDFTNSKVMRKITMLWALYFQMQIIQGFGDFPR